VVVDPLIFDDLTGLVDHAGTAPQFDGAIELPRDPQLSERGVHHQAQASSDEVIDQREDAKAPAVHQRVGHEFERPAQIVDLEGSPSAPSCPGPVCGLCACERSAARPCKAG
jgi:hypothetical protein